MKKILKKMFMIISCFIMITCSLSFINLSTNNNNESNRRLVSDSSVVEPITYAVPTDGYVENIYFNTSLSVDEVLNIIENADLSYTDTENGKEYTVLKGNSLSNYISILYVAEMNLYAIYYDLFEMGMVWLSNDSLAEQGLNLGWNSSFSGVIEFNENITGAGTQNNLLTPLVATVDYDEYAVPSSGLVEYIYFNTSLPEKDVISILSTLDYIDVSSLGFEGYEAVFIYSDSTMNYALAAVKTNDGGYFISLITDMSNVTDLWGEFSEWDNLQNNPLVINSDNYLASYASNFSQNIQNKKLISLISSQPYEEEVEEESIIGVLLSSIGLGISSIVGVVVNGIKESFLEFVFVDKNSDNLVVSDIAYFLFAMLGFSIAVGLIWLVIFMFKRRE